MSDRSPDWAGADLDALAVEAAPERDCGDAPRYDTLSSADASDFTVGTCMESDDPSDTAATETTDPGPGVAWFYLIRAENDCPAGQGTLGTGTGGTPRSGRSCP